MVETGGAVAEILQRMVADRAPGRDGVLIGWPDVPSRLPVRR